MSSNYIQTLYVTSNTFFNDTLNFRVNPALIDPRLITELQTSQSILVGTEFEREVSVDFKYIAQVYVDTIFAPVTASQHYEITVQTPIANREVFLQTIDTTFRELDVLATELDDEFIGEYVE